MKLCTCSLLLLFVGRIFWLEQRNLLVNGGDNDDETKASDEEDDNDGVAKPQDSCIALTPVIHQKTQ